MMPPPPPRIRPPPPPPDTIERVLRGVSIASWICWAAHMYSGAPTHEVLALAGLGALATFGWVLCAGFRCDT